MQREYGPPAVLVPERMPLRPPGRGEIRLSTIAAAVNYSDLQIRAGRWPIRRTDPFPYVPGLEVVGEVVEVGPAADDWQPGDVAVSMMQGMGGVRSERPGGYAEIVTIPAATAARVPVEVDPLIAATIGLAGVTAYAGLQQLGTLSGATIVVTGATGGVGSIAVRIAAALGARPVAGPLFAQCAAALRAGGRYCLVGAAAGGTVTWDAFGLLNGIVLTGWSSETLDGPQLRAGSEQLKSAERARAGRVCSRRLAAC